MQIWIALIVSSIVGPAIIGAFVARIASQYERKRDEREFALARRGNDRELQMDLLRRLSDIAYAMHTELSFYERWIRHAQPPEHEMATRRAEVDRRFTDQRARLGSLQTEIDAHFGEHQVPKNCVHRMTDIAMLRYALILGLPASQVDEIVDHLSKSGHSGMTGDELQGLLSEEVQPPTNPPIMAKLDKNFAKALQDSMHALLSTELDSNYKGFRSGKLLTAYDC